MQKVLTNFHPDCGCCVAVHIGGSARLGGRDSGDAKDAIAALALTHWLAACKGGDQASEASAIFFSKQKKPSLSAGLLAAGIIKRLCA